MLIYVNIASKIKIQLKYKTKTIYKNAISATLCYFCETEDTITFVLEVQGEIEILHFWDISRILG